MSFGYVDGNFAHKLAPHQFFDLDGLSRHAVGGHDPRRRARIGETVNGAAAAQWRRQTRDPIGDPRVTELAI